METVKVAKKLKINGKPVKVVAGQMLIPEFMQKEVVKDKEGSISTRSLT